jgi:hypothetical protein
MNPDKEKRLEGLTRHNPFWVCFIVFLLLAGDYGFRLVNLLAQREQLNQALLMQSQNLGVLAQARQLEARLEGFSLDLIQLSKTNAVARQIVQEFNIQWTPSATAPSGTMASGAAPAVATQPLPAAPVPAGPMPVRTPVGTNK